jgi:hypothetical protein
MIKDSQRITHERRVRQHVKLNEFVNAARGNRTSPCVSQNGHDDTHLPRGELVRRDVLLNRAADTSGL